MMNYYPMGEACHLLRAGSFRIQPFFFSSDIVNVVYFGNFV